MKDGKELVVLAGGMSNAVIHEVWIENGYFKHHTVTPGETVIDIGANIGAFSILAASMGAKVHAFEPHPNITRLLRMNIILNDMEKMITTNENAVAAESGSLRFYCGKDKDSGGFSIFSHWRAEENTDMIEVQAISLSGYIEKQAIQEIGLLKMDCEGAEYEIISTLPKWVFGRIKDIVLEYHLVQEHTPAELVTQLENNGFDCCLEPPTGQVGYIYATRKGDV